MKKKRFLRFFSLILCLCFALFSFAGCGNVTGGGDIDDGDDSETSEQEPTLLGGVKTLTRPENYDYDAALDGFSENFYNVFSGYIMSFLYQNYADNSLGAAQQSKIFTTTDGDGYKALVIETGVNTYPLSDAVLKYYFYDTPRYQITKITDEYNSADELIKQTLVLDASKAWKWGMNTDVEGKNSTYSIFKNYLLWKLLKR